MAKIDISKTKYKAKMKTAYEKKHYAKGLAGFTGKPQSEVEAGAMNKNWEDMFKDDTARTERADKWYDNFLAALLAK